MKKLAIDAVMSMYLSADTRWVPDKFWAVDVVEADWTLREFQWARVAQEVADNFLKQMITRG